MAVRKVALSVPADLYRAVETVRKKAGRTRSAVMQEALRYWLMRQEEAALVQRYEAGYRARPEGRREIAAARAAAVRLLAAEEW